VSTAPTPYEDQRGSASDTAAGLLAAISLTASVVACAYRPVRLAPFAIGIALVAAALAKERNSKLAAFAVVVGAIAWLVGMSIAVLTSNPIY